MTTLNDFCPYCQTKTTFTGWHGCSQAQSARERLNTLLGEIHLMGRGERLNVPETRYQVKDRADRLRQMARFSKVNGGNPREEYL